MRQVQSMHGYWADLLGSIQLLLRCGQRLLQASCLRMGLIQLMPQSSCLGSRGVLCKRAES